MGEIFAYFFNGDNKFSKHCDPRNEHWLLKLLNHIPKMFFLILSWLIRLSLRSEEVLDTSLKLLNILQRVTCISSFNASRLKSPVMEFKLVLLLRSSKFS